MQLLQIQRFAKYDQYIMTWEIHEFGQLMKFFVYNFLKWNVVLTIYFLLV